MRSAGARRAVAGVLVVVALGGAACGEDGDDAATAETVPPGPAPHEPGEVAPGCGEQGATDPDDLSADREVARCGPDAPEPEALPAVTPLRVAVPPDAGEELAPLLLADRLGELEAENLAVEIVERTPAEAMDELAAGELDVVVGPLGGPFFDAVYGGSGAQAVLGGTLTRWPNRVTTPQTGLWVRRDAVGDPDDLSDLPGQRVGVPGGGAGAAVYPVGRTVEARSATLANVALVDAAGDEAATQLQEGGLAAAWLDGVSWLPLADDEAFELLATLPATESLDGTVFSRRLTGPDRAVGLAYVRAVIRTINTHLTGDYQSDDDVVAALADATGLDEDAITGTRPLLFDWEIRDGTLPRIEDALLATGGVGYDAAQPRDRFVDRSLARDAVSEDRP